MSDPPDNEHPERLLRRLGVSEGPAMVAVGVMAGLQYVFLVKLWEGYPVRWAGDVIHPNVVAAGAALSLLGAATLAALLIWRWQRAGAAARRHAGRCHVWHVAPRDSATDRTVGRLAR